MELRIKESGGKSLIFDRFRGKWVRHTPEEGVRQWFCSYLVEQRGYPMLSISTERGIKLNGTTRRCDTIIYKGLNPVMLIEFKAPDVKLDSEVILQAMSYNTKLRAPYIVIANSKELYCIKLDLVNGTHSYLPEVPDFQQL